ncbi:MAG: glycosyltransferase, partial [Prevotella sp.]|nr:glycosyltransferase [Prevotella sp.]
RKQRLLTAAGNLTFVAVSEWLADKARSSALIGRLPIKVIPNAISLSRFKAIDRIDARTVLDVNEPHVLAFGAARIDDPIKGFSYLVEALHLLIDNGRLDKNDVRLLLFGDVRNPEALCQLPVPYTHLGYLDDEDRLSLVYSASDATISSSLYETFGQTLIEAMACGSIPISFSGSGQADIITHLKNGYLADRLSAESLADGILWALKHPIPARELRRSVSRRYAESVVANRYVELYDQLLGGKLL